MPRTTRAPLLPAVAVVLALTACTPTGGGADSAPTATAPAPTGPPSGSAEAVTPAPLLRGLDVCALPTAGLVEAAGGVPGTASTRSLERLPGYAGVVDECGFGTAFRSTSFRVAVGLAAAAPADLAAGPGRPVGGLGEGARAGEVDGVAEVRLLRGRTLVRLTADRYVDGRSRLPALVRVARRLAPRVPASPPDADLQTRGRCADLGGDGVARLLGSAPAVSRSLAYPSGAATCAWATAARGGRTLNLALYTFGQAGPFLAALRETEPFTPVPDVPGDAFTVPGAAYVVAADGQAAALRGSVLDGTADRPARVTPALTNLLRDLSRLIS